ncbi:MAG TPA: peptidoglycan-binding protein, partial [Pyrinomonadaceae bacterium]|nr:peptidoglycan-binding protein [Pyrinomonadaceae bacterium]
MFERDLLFRELAGVNREYEAAGRDFFLDISLNTPNTIIEEAAVKPFNQEDRSFLFADLLPLKPSFVSKKISGKTVKAELPSIERAVKKNSDQGGTKKKPAPTNKIFGVDTSVFLDRLQKYVDFPAIEQALTAKYPALVIDKLNPLNELAAEAVHQFQAKIFTDAGDWDGIIGPSVMSSLGFVFHEGKRFKSGDANATIKGKFKAIDKSIKDYIAGLTIGLPDINGSTWFDFIINPSIFGWRGIKGFGFHLLLMLKLREVENNLYAALSSELTGLFDKEISSSHGFKSKTYGQVPRLLGKALGINEHHGDIRKVSESTPLSRHLSGMAIDINYTTNPWIKGTQGLSLINKALKAAKKPAISIKGIATIQQFFADLAEKNNTADVFDRLKEYSDDCRIFLGTGAINWGASRRSPNRGFLNLRKELVTGLRDSAGLAWGAVDFGTGDDGNGDVMHFDMRTSSIGQAYSEAIGQEGIHDYLEKIHRNFQRVVFPKPVKKKPAKPAPKKDKESSFGFERDLLSRELESISRDFFEPPVIPVQDAYSGLHLQLGDSDTKRIFEGRKRTDIQGNPVRQLQTDLKTLGIGLIGKPDGGFGFDTECAVREFQIYAKMPQIAHQPQGAMRKMLQKSRGLLAEPIYGEDFWDVPNTDKYTGEVNGVANDEVRRLLQKWKDNSWRIPVIVQAWTIKNGDRDKIFNKNDNIWKYNEVKSTAPRMYVKDLSGYYTFPATRSSSDPVVLGDYAKYGSWGGPSSEGAAKSWSETEITPDSLLKKSLAALSPSERSTFMVIRAVSEVECIGHLDRMNAYDNAFVSFGPFHWVLGLATAAKVTDGGEISSYIAYLKEKDRAAYDKAFGFFGLDAHKNWNSNGQDFFYSGGIRNYGKGRPAIKRGTKTVSLPNDRSGLDFGNYLRSWHWFYRFVMAARTISGFTRYIWDFARLRIRDIS